MSSQKLIEITTKILPLVTAIIVPVTMWSSTQNDVSNLKAFAQEVKEKEKENSQTLIDISTRLSSIDTSNTYVTKTLDEIKQEIILLRTGR